MTALLYNPGDALDTMRPLISVIVPNYQGKKVFPACIRSLLRQDRKDIEIILVDDASTDGSAALAAKLYAKESRVQVIPKAKNTGYVGACNEGLRHAKGKYVIVTNNDATFPKDWVSQMYRSVDGKPKVIGASLVLQQGAEKELFARIRKHEYGIANPWGFGSLWRTLHPAEDASHLVESAWGGVLILPRAALGKEIFRPEYVFYGEDIELCWRLRTQGYCIVTNLDAHMHHIGSYTRKVDKSMNTRAIMHGTKNRIINTLVFWRLSTLLRILPPFLLFQLLLFLIGPRAMRYRIRAYWWIITHWGFIRRTRKEIQTKRTVDDREILRVFSSTLYDPRDVPRYLRPLAGLANGCLYAYSWLVRLPIPKNPTALVHVPAVVDASRHRNA